MANKADRTKVKRAVTKQVNALRQLAAEDIEDEEIKRQTDKLKEIFREFVTVHESYTNSLKEEDEIEESEEYFVNVQRDYIEILNVVMPSPSIPAKMSDKPSEIWGAISLPKLTLEPFDGDPSKYHAFIFSFEQNVEKMTTDGSAKLLRLLQYTRGEAKEAIRMCTLIGGEEGYCKARDTLAKRFGDDSLVTERILSSIKKGGPLKTPLELRRFADDIENAILVLKRLRRLPELDTQSSIVEMVGRLQPFIQNRWRKRAMEKKKDTGEYPDIDEFVNFISDIATEVNDPVYGKLNSKKPESRQKQTSFHASTYMRREQLQRRESPCILCKETHRFWYCQKFKDMKVNERRDLVKNHRLCENCLMNNHYTANCRKPSVCSVPGCGMKHTKFLHVSKEENSTPKKSTNCSSSTELDAPSVYLPVVEVRVNAQYHTYALLDSASTSSFCTSSLVKKLRLQNSEASYSLSTLSKRDEEKRTKCVSLELDSQGSPDTISMNDVYVIENIPANLPTKQVDHFPHLKGIPLTKGNIKVEILIGQDNAEALIPLEVRRGNKGEPFATRTILGWSLNGPVNFTVNRKVTSHFITVQTEMDMSNSDITSEKTGPSAIDEKVLLLWERECRLSNGHYELPIPWKTDKKVPNNLVAAAPRLSSLKRSITNKGIMPQYHEEMDKLLKKGYAEKVPDDEILTDNPTWYLPHHPVITDEKPGKLRVVFDCAAKFKGESLNDKVNQGPDLNNKLVNVLLRFRENEYAFVADIEVMYNQVKVP
ncbi:uncharacterized protein LOC106167743 [Lingula anatina]|uniref:Uncharacterized protein LOC106167743 n=1 Tax=Lingula anatina TaxID=7574 RepID=A0A1S3IVG3_LINAN|nr:uncharacterized protein LOC106167743 [Lingula anatina]|eukprot:XP_013402058.1 uncharacterized protein LOC106167743 [Lingula anatina]